MAKTKKIKKTGLFCVIISVLTAVILISASCTMGIANMLLNDEFYANITIHDLMYKGISGIIQAYFSQSALLIGLVIFLIVTVAFYIIIRISENCLKLIKVSIIVLSIAFILRCLALAFWNLPQTSDFKLNYELSELVSTIPIGYWGRFLHELNTMYVGIWSAHMPYIIYQTFVIKTGISLGFLNAVYGTATCIFTALIAKELFGKKAFVTALIIMAINPLEVLFVPVLSNQHIATMFFVLGMWLIIKSDAIPNAILGAIAFAMSQIFRPEMIVAIIGITIYYIYTIENKKKKIIDISVFIFMFVAIIIVFDIIFRATGLISGHIFSGNIGYKLCVGLNKESGGGWSQADVALMGNPELIRTTLVNRISESGNILQMIQKTLYQFGSYVYPWVLDLSNHAGFSNIIGRRTISAFMVIISLIAAMKLIKDRKNKKMFAVSIVILGYMAVFALIEVQARYNYLIIPLLTVLVSDISMKTKKGMKNGRTM